MVDLHPKTCNLCRGKVVLVPNAKVYGKSYGSGMCYLCTKCGAFVGTHEPRPDEALGLLADSRMRNTKKRCHALFDRHWSDKEQKRTCRTAMYWIILKKEVDHTQKRGQKIKEKRRPNWEASHYYENEGGESYKSRGYT